MSKIIQIIPADGWNIVVNCEEDGNRKTAYPLACWALTDNKDMPVQGMFAMSLVDVGVILAEDVLDWDPETAIIGYCKGDPKKYEYWNDGVSISDFLGLPALPTKQPCQDENIMK